MQRERKEIVKAQGGLHVLGMRFCLAWERGQSPDGSERGQSPDGFSGDSPQMVLFARHGRWHGLDGPDEAEETCQMELALSL
jgi:hypothetical protein